MEKSVLMYRFKWSRSLLKTLLIMKLAIIIILVTTLQVNALPVYGQNVSLKLNQTEIKKVLKMIESEGYYRFLYNSELKGLKTKVDFFVQNLNIDESLNTLFKGTNLTFKHAGSNLIVIVSTNEAEAQKIRVTGKITGENNEPLAGASVLIKGGKSGTSADNYGVYSIDVEENTTLIISSIGYESQEVVVSGRSTIDVKLVLSNKKIDEVVVVGYGTQKKSVVTGSISSIKAKDLENVPNGRVEQTLQGRVSGVTIAQNSGQPGSSSTIRIRGVTTFGSAGNNPLWVIDNVVVDNGGIGYLNQSDIESIEVLKDAASAAIYGTRAATGVILVTTKKGKAGKITFSYNGFYGTSSPEKILKVLNATEYGALMNERALGGGGSVMFSDLSTLGVGTDWQKAVFNYGAKRHNHELSLSGGNERSTFYMSFGEQNQEGIVASEISKYNKKNIRLNSTHKITKNITLGQTLGYSHQKATGIGATDEYGGILSSAINLDPITPLVVTDPAVAALAPYTNLGAVKDANGNPYGISSLVGQEMKNPIAYMQTRLGGYDWADDIVGNAYLEVAINKEIKVKSTLGAKLAYWGGVAFTPVYYLSATSLTTQNSYGKSNENVFNWNVENTITYTKKFDDHNLTVLLGQAAYSENNGGGQGTTLFNLPITNYKDASFSFDIPSSSRTTSSYDAVQHKVSSLFSRLNYNYKEKYLFTGILRRDGSTRFGANHKYGVFPSFSFGWVTSKEDFWNWGNTISHFKLRGGYGKVGNDNIRNFGYLATVAGGFNYSLGNSGIITTGYSPTSLDNPDLRWEETTQGNIGFEATVLKNFNVVVDWYNKKTNGILRPVTIPGYVGVTTAPVANIADMENKGLEIELGYRKKIGQLNLSTNANISFLKNKVTYVASDADFITGDASFQSMSVVTITKVGESYNSFYGYQTAGIFQNMAEVNAYTNKSGALIQPNARPGDFKWVDVNGDGAISALDKTILGNNLPKYTYGLTVNLDYKGFDCMMFMQGAAGNKIFQGLRRLDIGNANYQTIALTRWHGEGTSNTFPRLSSSDPNGNFTNMSDFYLEKGDYARIKLVQLGYTLPAKMIKKIMATKARVYITAENLLTLTKYSGYDPEIGGGVFGIDKGYYPQARSFIFGVQLQF